MCQRRQRQTRQRRRFVRVVGLKLDRVRALLPAAAPPFRDMHTVHASLPATRCTLTRLAFICSFIADEHAVDDNARWRAYRYHSVFFAL